MRKVSESKEKAAYVRRAASYEKKTCAILKQLIENLGGGKEQRKLNLYQYHVQKAAQDVANAMYDTPTDYPLRDSLPEDFRENFPRFRALAKEMYAEYGKATGSVGAGINRHRRKRQSLVLSRLEDFGFIFSDFTGKPFKGIESFVVEYPDYPEMIA